MGERPNFFYTWQLDDQGIFSPNINKKVGFKCLLFYIGHVFIFRMPSLRLQLTAPDYIAKVIETNTVLINRIVAMEQGA
jgi:hypothetical protein